MRKTARIDGSQLDELYDAAHDDELATLDALAIRAGLMWQCPEAGCGYVNETGLTCCGNCGKTPGGWEWAIVNYGGVIIDRFPTQVAAHEHLMDDKYRAGSHIEYVGEDGEG